MTPKIKVVPFEPWHLGEIRMKACHETERPPSIDSPAMTFLIENQPVAILGCFFVMDGILQVWSFISEGCRKAPLAFHKTCLSLLEHYEDFHKLRRIQITVRVDYPEGCHWAEALGFKREGVMRKYGYDETDYALYARVS